MFSRIASWLRPPRVQLVDDLEAGSRSEKVPHTSHHLHTSPAAYTSSTHEETAGEESFQPKDKLLDRYPHLLDASTITLLPSAAAGHWLLCPAGSARFWVWTWLRMVLLIARLGVCWAVLSAVEALS